jgi:hypothetical protein
MDDIELQRFKYMLDTVVQDYRKTAGADISGHGPYRIMKNANVQGQRDLVTILNKMCKIVDEDKISDGPVLHCISPQDIFCGNLQGAECVHDDKREIYAVLLYTMKNNEMAISSVVPKNVWAFIPGKEHATLVIEDRGSEERGTKHELYSLSMPSSNIARNDDERELLGLIMQETRRH